MHHDWWFTRIRSCEENNAKIKKLTRKLYGQRPKSLMVGLLAIVAQVWGIETLLAVKNSIAHLRS